MSDRIFQCIVESFRILPTSVYVWLVGVLCVGTVLLWAFLGFRKGTWWAAVLLLVEYLFWIYCMTVFFRDVQRSRTFNLTPFWSYRAIRSGNPLLLLQDILNVVAFIPVGLLLGCTIGRLKCWQVLLIGLALSMCIEILQLFLLRGFAEFDDLFHNMVGCLVGYGVFVGISQMIIK